MPYDRTRTTCPTPKPSWNRTPPRTRPSTRAQGAGAASGRTPPADRSATATAARTSSRREEKSPNARARTRPTERHPERYAARRGPAAGSGRAQHDPGHHGTRRSESPKQGLTRTTHRPRAPPDPGTQLGPQTTTDPRPEEPGRKAEGEHPRTRAQRASRKTPEGETRCGGTRERAVTQPQQGRRGHLARRRPTSSGRPRDGTGGDAERETVIVERGDYEASPHDEEGTCGKSSTPAGRPGGAPASTPSGRGPEGSLLLVRRVGRGWTRSRGVRREHPPIGPLPRRIGVPDGDPEHDRRPPARPAGSRPHTACESCPPRPEYRPREPRGGTRTGTCRSRPRDDRHHATDGATGGAAPGGQAAGGPGSRSGISPGRGWIATSTESHLGRRKTRQHLADHMVDIRGRDADVAGLEDQGSAEARPRTGSPRPRRTAVAGRRNRRGTPHRTEHDEQEDEGVEALRRSRGGRRRRPAEVPHDRGEAAIDHQAYELRAIPPGLLFQGPKAAKLRRSEKDRDTIEQPTVLRHRTPPAING